METTTNQSPKSDNMSPLEEKALQVYNLLGSKDESQLSSACTRLENAIMCADLTKQRHYSLLGSALFYILTKKEPDKISSSLKSQMTLCAAHYCLLRYIRDTERGDVQNSISDYASALKRAFLCSKMFNNYLTGGVYSFAEDASKTYVHYVMGKYITGSLYSRLQETGVKVRCDEITEVLYFMECLKKDMSSLIFDNDAKTISLVNKFIDEVLYIYEYYVFLELQQRFEDTYMF